MENQDDENNQRMDPPEPLYEIQLDETLGEIWGSALGSYEVSVTYFARRAKWWQRWRSDLPFPGGNQKEIVEVLKIAQSWISRRKKQAVSPSFAELKVYW